MSDLEIRSGGAIAVDAASLESAADEASALAALLQDAAADVERAVALFGLADLAWPTGPSLVRWAEACAEEARALERALREAAAGYERVEARAARGADARGTGDWAGEFVRQTVLGLLPFGFLPTPTALVLAGTTVLAVRQAARGRIPAGAVLEGEAAPPPMRATAVAPSGRPASLAELAGRIPASPDRVRVERYAMPDGARRFAVYVGGTQGWAGAEPWDMSSNLRLYTGTRSDSYAATEAALAASGARQGDAVYAVGHSQGAMIASRLALEGGYDTRALVTFGSPVEAEVGAGTLSVQVRHRDDPVALLAGGGSPAPVGAPGGFVAERTADPQPSIGDLALGAHQLSAYEETARLVDASADPRVAHLRDVLGELADAPAEVTTWAPVVSGPGSAAGG
ncbi:hypothetical protein ABCS02_13160 [Microbacterium sp. X-17]|uniref:hypothetical protein n=1 Tax=Microbacterium sp. X-17 TaxID=3144404 RepID=UPI0031F51EBF